MRSATKSDAVRDWIRRTYFGSLEPHNIFLISKTMYNALVYICTIDNFFGKKSSLYILDRIWVESQNFEVTNSIPAVRDFIKILIIIQNNRQNMVLKNKYLKFMLFHKYIQKHLVLVFSRFVMMVETYQNAVRDFIPFWNMVLYVHNRHSPHIFAIFGSYSAHT